MAFYGYNIPASTRAQRWRYVGVSLSPVTFSALVFPAKHFFHFVILSEREPSLRGERESKDPCIP